MRLKEEEKDAEIARLQEQMRQLSIEKEREVAEMRRQLQTTPPQKQSKARKSVSVYIQQVSNKYRYCYHRVLNSYVNNIFTRRNVVLIIPSDEVKKASLSHEF